MSCKTSASSSLYVFYTDPGHGWLAVKRCELKRLGILDKITSYSYQLDDTIFLEEDCDAGIFLAAKKKVGEIVNIKESNCSYSSIRSCQHFSL